MQSQESGGHGASPASLVSLIPELVDWVDALCQKHNIQQAVPVAAAGGICDARQVCLLGFAHTCSCSQVPGLFAAASSRQEVLAALTMHQHSYVSGCLEKLVLVHVCRPILGKVFMCSGS